MSITKRNVVGMLFAGILMSGFLACDTLHADIVTTSGVTSHTTSDVEPRKCPSGERTDMLVAGLDVPFGETEPRKKNINVSWSDDILVSDEANWPEFFGSTSRQGNIVSSVPEPRFMMMLIFFVGMWLLTRRHRFVTA